MTENSVSLYFQLPAFLTPSDYTLPITHLTFLMPYSEKYFLFHDSQKKKKSEKYFYSYIFVYQNSVLIQANHFTSIGG